MRGLPLTGQPRTYQTLAVTARLQAPMAAYDEAIHLDGLLTQSIARRLGVQVPNPDRDTPLSEFAPVPLPIRHIDYGGHRVALASAGMFADDWRSGVERLTKKKDEADIHARARPWKVSAGPERAYCVPVPTIEAASVTWLVVGHHRGVKAAARSVRRVGGWRRHGYGLVAEWDVEPVDVDAGEVLVAGGVARRHLPAAWCSRSGGMDRGRITGPYWHPEGEVARVRAGVSCDVLSEVLARARREVTT